VVDYDGTAWRFNADAIAKVTRAYSVRLRNIFNYEGALASNIEQTPT